LVPTIFGEDRLLVLELVLGAATTIGRGLSGDELFILESTATPGTTAGSFTEAVTFSSLNPGVHEMGSATEAEAVKEFEGVYRDLNIALANKLALACEE
jgi:UDP-N-acetyl-D-mannosaminuronate dehydrogenase